MKVHRLYADQNGESHFEDVEIDRREEAMKIGFMTPPPGGASLGAPEALHAVSQMPA